jgi:protein-L-isoaspartate(D-aspartate) O-methyltransferase
MVPDTAALRANMVAAQVRTNDVTDARICNAMLTIPRERFVPQALQEVAYADARIPLGNGRVLPDARSFAKLLQLAAVKPDDVALDVGCATGYSSAVLSLLAGRVFALEESAELARAAEDNLRALGAANVSVIRGKLPQGCPQYAPFDAIVLNGACEIAPAGLLAQLKDGGRLVAIKRNGAAGYGCVYLSHAGAIGERKAFDAQLPVLPGFEKPKSFVF